MQVNPGLIAGPAFVPTMQHESLEKSPTRVGHRYPANCMLYLYCVCNDASKDSPSNWSDILVVLVGTKHRRWPQAHLELAPRNDPIISLSTQGPVNRLADTIDLHIP